MSANLATLPEDALRICKLSGAEAAVTQSRLVSLRDCEELLKQCIRDAERALDSHAFYRTAELAARVVLVTCDIAILWLESATGPAGIAVEKLYSAGKLIADAISGNISTKQAVMMLLDNKAKVAELSARYIGDHKAAGAIQTARDLVSLSNTLWEQVSGATSGLSGDAGIESAIKTTRSQLAKIQQRMRDLETDLENCWVAN